MRKLVENSPALERAIESVLAAQKTSLKNPIRNSWRTSLDEVDVTTEYTGPFRITFGEGRSIRITNGIPDPFAYSAGVVNVNGYLFEVPTAELSQNDGYVVLKAYLPEEATTPTFSWLISSGIPVPAEGANEGFAIVGEVLVTENPGGGTLWQICQYYNSVPVILISANCDEESGNE